MKDPGSDHRTHGGKRGIGGIVRSDFEDVYDGTLSIDRTMRTRDTLVPGEIGARGRVVVVLLIVLGLLMAAMIPFLPDTPTKARISPGRALPSDFALHDIIVVDGDSDFVTQGWPGEGTVDNPYLIDGLEIDGIGHKSGVHIGNTTSYFLLSNCFVHDAQESGVVLYNVIHGTILDTLCSSNTWNGLVVSASSEVKVDNVTCSESVLGMLITSCSSLLVQNGNFSMNGEGISMRLSNGNRLLNNTCSWNLGDGSMTSGSGIHIITCNSNTISNNSCSWNGVPVGSNLYTAGIKIETSSNNVLIGNELMGNRQGGISLDDSDNNQVDECSFSPLCDYGVSMVSSSNNMVRRCHESLEIFVHDSSNDNVIENSTCGVAAVGIINSDGNRFSNNSIGGTRSMSLLPIPQPPLHLIDVTYSSDTEILNNTCVDFVGYGVYVELSTNCTVDGNNFLYGLEGNSFGSGIGIVAAISSGRFSNNTCSFNQGDGIHIGAGCAGVAENNTCNSNGRAGIRVSCDGFRVSSNHCSENNGSGIWLNDCTGCTLTGNTMSENGILLGWVSYTPDFVWFHNIDTTNTVNGLPVQYWKNQVGGTVPSGAGQVILAGCTGVVVEGQDLRNGTIPICIGYSSGNFVRNNTLTQNNWLGMHLMMSDLNTIADNAIFDNPSYGVYISSGSGNLIWNNTFARNNGASTIYDSSHIQAYDGGSNNRWNSSTRGNYWDDWTSPDSDYDGIVDHPYVLQGSARDFYPLAGMTVPIHEFGLAGLTVCMVLLALAIAATSARRRR